MKSLIIALALAVTSGAQTAKVVMLSPTDAAQVKAAHEKLTAAQAEYDKVKKAIEVKYLQVSEKDPDKGNCFTSILLGEVRESPKYWRKGFDWTCGSWEFSDDFRFVVPLPPPPKLNTSPWIQPGTFIVDAK